jgi:hypothetical protein
MTKVGERGMYWLRTGTGFAVALAALTSDAANVTGAVEAAAARRAAQQARSAAAVAAERAAYQRILRDVDANVIRRIEQRFSRHVRPDAVRGLPPPTYLDRDAFDRALMQRYPQLSAEQRKAILGYATPDGKITINVNQPEAVLTLAHERMHQLAHPRFRETFGGGIDEGASERFARLVANDMRLADLPPVYPSELRVVDALGARVGFDRLSRAYFQGDVGQITRVLELDLGQAGAARFTRAAQRHDLDDALNALIGR